MINLSCALIYSRRLFACCNTLFECPIYLINIKHTLDFPCWAYFDDMRMPHISGANCSVKVKIPISVPPGRRGLYYVATLFVGVSFRYVLIISHFHNLLRNWLTLFCLICNAKLRLYPIYANFRANILYIYAYFL